VKAITPIAVIAAVAIKCSLCFANTDELPAAAEHSQAAQGATQVEQGRIRDEVHITPIPVRVMQTSVEQAFSEKQQARLNKHDDDDLAVQKVTAYAAVGAAILAAFQLIFLIITVRYAKITADAGRDAANAAIDSVKTMERHERPYLFFRAITIQFTTHEFAMSQAADRAGPAGHGIIFGVVNEGRSPAILKSVKARLVLGNRLPDEPDYSDCLFYGPHFTEALGPGDESSKFPIYWEFDRANDEAQFRAFHRGETNFFIFGLIEYEDAAGISYATGFGFKASNVKELTVLSDHGGKAYNYRV